MSYYFTSESVSEGHPDKVADQISDALIDNFLAFDPESKVACETLVTTGQVVLAGEVKSKANLDVQSISRKVINEIGYNKSEYMFDANSCGVLSAIHEQSSDINQGVEKSNPHDQGAGDQGMMFGYACNETENYMPLALDLSHKILFELAELRKENNEIKYLRPDSKSQVTLQYSEDHKPEKIVAIVISTQHDDFDSESNMLSRIKSDVLSILIPRVLKKYPNLKKFFNTEIKYHINPTGKFVIGGPHGDTGLTGRKIIVDTYGGYSRHGGGAFSGKDPTKVDRSAAYAARHAAKNIVAAGLARRCEIQLSYAIGVAMPTSINLNTFGTGQIADEDITEIVKKVFDFRPYSIIKNFELRELPSKNNGRFYQDIAKYGHFGRNDLDLPWERLDKVADLKKESEHLMANSN